MRTMRDGSQQTVLRLQPDHLGPVTVTVEVQAGAVRMHLLADGTALAALQQSLPELRSQLAQGGLALSDVTLRQPDSGGQGWAGRGDGGRQQPPGQPGGPDSRPPPPKQPAEPAPETGERPPGTGRRRLDVRV